MSITKEEFEKGMKVRLVRLPILKFLYENRDKAYTLTEIVETGLVGETNDFVSLVGIGYVDMGINGTLAINSKDYFTISEKGIKMMEKK